MYCTVCAGEVKPAEGRPSLDARFGIGKCFHCEPDIGIDRQLVASKEVANDLIRQRRETKERVAHARHEVAGKRIRACAACRELDAQERRRTAT